MDGIVFLSAEEIVKTTSAGAMGFVVVFFFFMLIGLVVGGLFALFSEDVGIFGIALTTFAVFGMIMGIAGACVEVETESFTEYKVLVQDEEALPYLIENYEIVGKTGDIYTIREKNQ